MRKKCNIRLRRLTLWMLACLTAVCLLPGRAEAGGIATDTLTVKVGYYGMDSSRYVEAGTYHGTELQENLTMYYEAYTFFRPTGEGDYRVVVDSAYGIHIDELLEYTRIHLNDVRSVQFYTRNQDVRAFPPLRSPSCSGPGTISRIFRPISCFLLSTKTQIPVRPCGQRLRPLPKCKNTSPDRNLSGDAVRHM